MIWFNSILNSLYFFLLSFAEDVPLAAPEQYVQDNFISVIHDNAMIFFGAMAGIAIFKMMVFR